ncbi:MAG: lipopolysaccharide transport periplasmic protein LptA [Gammaproteobacteria bacterium]|jgi:lipopolysaccharide export system protein LptA|nr:lipopolysaccharide transport periplasmic protein LptA [Gammaproteobacteria bacterium]
MRTNIIFFTFIIFITAASTVLNAYESDSDKPIFLESDSAKWDEESQKSTYRGNVIVTQGSMLLTGELLIVTSKNNEINRMVITGEKARYKQKTITGKIINGEAKKIQYYVDKAKIIFLDKAILTQTNNIVRSNRIVYKTDTENITAGDKKGKSRVKMTLEPKKDNE